MEVTSSNWKKVFFTIWSGQAFSLVGSQMVHFALAYIFGLIAADIQKHEIPYVSFCLFAGAHFIETKNELPNHG